jgi:hypothetical protein
MRAAALLALGAGGVAAQPFTPAQGDDAQLWTCGANPAGQSWLVETGPYPQNHITLAGSFNASAGGYYLVLDIAGWSNNTAAEIHVW